MQKCKRKNGELWRSGEEKIRKQVDWGFNKILDDQIEECHNQSLNSPNFYIWRDVRKQGIGREHIGITTGTWRE